MPHVIISTGIKASDGHEEILTEYICDWPDCPNIATNVLGYAKEIPAPVLASWLLKNTIYELDQFAYCRARAMRTASSGETR
jgi:hypothetical protein